MGRELVFVCSSSQPASPARCRGDRVEGDTERTSGVGRGVSPWTGRDGHGPPRWEMCGGEKRGCDWVERVAALGRVVGDH